MPRAAPRLWTGAASGAVTVLGFAVIHDLLIVDIWFNIGPMVVSGALCGLALVWSYNAAVPEHSTGRWLEYVGTCAALLVALGVVSLILLEPRFTIAELSEDDDALALLLGPSWWLMVWVALVGTILLWVRHGRRRTALPALLTAQSLLAFLVGHNFAVLGLVTMSSELLVGFAEFVALTVFLAGGLAAGVHALTARRAHPPPDAPGDG